MTAHKKIYTLEEIQDKPYITTRQAVVYGHTAEWWRDRANEDKIAHTKNGRDIMLLHTSVTEFLKSGSETMETAVVAGKEKLVEKESKEYMLYLFEECLISDKEHLYKVYIEQEETKKQQSNFGAYLKKREDAVITREANAIITEDKANTLLLEAQKQAQEIKNNAINVAVEYWSNWLSEKNHQSAQEIGENIRKGIEQYKLRKPVNGDNSATLDEAHKTSSLQKQHIEGSTINEKNIPKTNGIFDNKKIK